MKFIEKFVNLPRLIKTLYIMLWAVLIAFVVLKLCFNIWYPIAVNSVTFVNICEFIDGTKILKYVIMFVFYCVSANIIFLTNTKRKFYRRKIDFIAINISFLFVYIIKYFNNNIGSILEITNILILPIIINVVKKRLILTRYNILFPIVMYVLLNLWQLNIFFIKDVSNILNDMPTLIGIIIQIDYYIFLIISWIGVNYIMGLWSLGWLFGKHITKLEAIKERELAKETPDNELIAEIESIIEELKKDEKTEA